MILVSFISVYHYFFKDDLITYFWFHRAVLLSPRPLSWYFFCLFFFFLNLITSLNVCVIKEPIHHCATVFFFLKKKPVTSGQCWQVPLLHSGGAKHHIHSFFVGVFKLELKEIWAAKRWLQKKLKKLNKKKEKRLTCWRRSGHPLLVFALQRMSEMAQTLLSVFLSMEQNVEEQSWSLCTLSLGYMFGLTLTPAHESHHGKWPGWLESKRSFHGWIFYGGAVTEAAAARRGRGRFVFPFF